MFVKNSVVVKLNVLQESVFPSSYIGVLLLTIVFNCTLTITPVFHSTITLFYYLRHLVSRWSAAFYGLLIFFCLFILNLVFFGLSAC